MIAVIAYYYQKLDIIGTSAKKDPLKYIRRICMGLCESYYFHIIRLNRK